MSIQVKNTVKQACPVCGAPMRFDPTKQKMVCDYCDTEIDIAEDSAASSDAGNAAAASTTAAATAGSAAGSAADKPAADSDPKAEEKKTEKEKNKERKETILALDKWYDSQAEGFPVYKCGSCGAEVLAPKETSATTCPYCGQAIVLTDQLTGPLRPDAIVPFKITPDALPNAVKRFYKDMVLLPKDFFSQNSIGDIVGVYVPFWVYNGSLKGTASYFGEKVLRTYSEGDYTITEIGVFELDRACSAKFSGLPADASVKLADELMDSIEPFNLNEAKPFDTRYLAGYVAERFDQTSDEIEERIDKLLTKTAATAIRNQSTSGYSNVNYKGGHFDINPSEISYVLLPVYKLNLKYGGKKYSFVVNGQTGRVSGYVPTSKEREKFIQRTRSAIGFAVAAAIIAAIVLL